MEAQVVYLDALEKVSSSGMDYVSTILLQYILSLSARTSHHAIFNAFTSNMHNGDAISVTKYQAGVCRETSPG